MKYNNAKAESASYSKTTKELWKEADTAKQLGTSEGYQSALFNLLFLMQSRVTSFMSNKKFDEDLFRTYFSKIYKSLVSMESSFMTALTDNDRNSFIKYSDSLKDLASYFKITSTKAPISISHASLPGS